LEGDELEGAVDLGLHAIVARAGLELFGLELLAARLDLALHPRRLPHELVHSTAKTHDLSCSLAFEGDLDVAFGLGEYIERVEDARVSEGLALPPLGVEPLALLAAARGGLLRIDRGPLAAR